MCIRDSYKGYHSDAARTHAVGEIRPDLQKLIDVTRESFFEGIKFAKEGNHLYDISRAIGDYAESFGYGVVREPVSYTHLDVYKRQVLRHPYPDVSAELIWLVQSSTAKELFRFRH